MLPKMLKNVVFYKVWRAMTIPRVHVCLTLTFKIIEITVEVSQKSTLQEMLKITREDSTQLKSKIAYIWPVKKSFWSLLILLFLTMRPPKDFIWALDVNMRVNQKWTSSHSEKSFFRRRSQFWVVRKCIWTDTQRLRAKIATFLLMPKFLTIINLTF